MDSRLTFHNCDKFCFSEDQVDTQLCPEEIDLSYTMIAGTSNLAIDLFNWHYCNVKGTIIESEGKVVDIDYSVYFKLAADFFGSIYQAT